MQYLRMLCVMARRPHLAPSPHALSFAGSVFWPAANMFNFMLVPPSGRVLYVNAAGLLWNTFLRCGCRPFGCWGLWCPDGLATRTVGAELLQNTFLSCGGRSFGSCWGLCCIETVSPPDGWGRVTAEHVPQGMLGPGGGSQPRSMTWYQGSPLLGTRGAPCWVTGEPPAGYGTDCVPGRGPSGGAGQRGVGMPLCAC